MERADAAQRAAARRRGALRWHVARLGGLRLAASNTPCHHSPYGRGAVLRDDPRPGLGPLPGRARAARGLPPGRTDLVAAPRRAPRVGRREPTLRALLRRHP